MPLMEEQGTQAGFSLTRNTTSSPIVMACPRYQGAIPCNMTANLPATKKWDLGSALPAHAGPLQLGDGYKLCWQLPDEGLGGAWEW